MTFYRTLLILKYPHNSINVLLEIYVKLLAIKKTYLVAGTTIDFGFLEANPEPSFQHGGCYFDAYAKNFDYRRPRVKLCIPKRP